MTSLFFPNDVFAWCYYGLLVLGCLALVYTDLRVQRLPNYLTVPLCLLGILLNTIRGSWVGSLGVEGRLFGGTGVFGGTMDGLCLALAGAITAFVLFMALWQMGLCGAGDVKLMAAIAAWLGPVWFFWVFAGTIVTVVPIMVIWWSYAFLTQRNRGKKISYALPTTISVALVMLWLWRAQLLSSVLEYRL